MESVWGYRDIDHHVGRADHSRCKYIEIAVGKSEIFFSCPKISHSSCYYLKWKYEVVVLWSGIVI